MEWLGKKPDTSQRKALLGSLFRQAKEQPEKSQEIGQAIALSIK